MADEKSNELEDHGVYLFMGEVDDESCKEVIEFIIKQNFVAKHEKLRVIINSGGGDTPAGFGVIDAIAGSKIPVQTIGIGILASMGLTIFIAGKKGERVLTPNTMIMSHQFGWCSYGKEHELIASRKGHDLLSDMLLRHYKKHTHLHEKDIRDKLMPASDVWLSAQEAKKLNLCDVVKEFD